MAVPVTPASATASLERELESARLIRPRTTEGARLIVIRESLLKDTDPPFERVMR